MVGFYSYLFYTHCKHSINTCSMSESTECKQQLQMPGKEPDDDGM